MSLKTFHVFFISVSVVLCIGFGVWCVNQPNYLPLGIGSFVVAAALVAYEIVFLKKLKTR
jgi:hypothetical protein